MSEQMQSAADTVAILGSAEEPQANERDYMFYDYDVKEVEHPADENLPSLDFTGPDNGGITYEQTGYVENPVSDEYAVDPNAPKIFLCPGHDANPDTTVWMATSQRNEDKIKNWMQSHTVLGNEATDDTAVILKHEIRKNYRYKSYQKALNWTCNKGTGKVKTQAQNWISTGIVCKAYPVGNQAGDLDEYKECFEIACLIKQQLEAKKCSVTICKNKADDSPSQDKDRALDGAKGGNDIIIALHECGTNDKFTITYKANGVAKGVAKSICTSLESTGYTKSKNIEKVSDGKKNPLHAWSSIPAVSVDFGKLKNDMGSDSARVAMAKSVVDGIADYYKLGDDK